jgi:hypothetical protein
MAIEEIEVFRDVLAKPGKKRRQHREAVVRAPGIAQIVSVEGTEQVAGMAEQALKGDGEIGKGSLTDQVDKVVHQELEVEVVKIPPNPRLVWAKYHQDGREHEILVRVRRNTNFKPRMKLKLERPTDWASRRTPWEYKGRLPRLPGRW